jgi:hypothetical protein
MSIANQEPQEIIRDVLKAWLQERADDMRDRLAKRNPYPITTANSPLAQGIAPSAIVAKVGGYSATIDLEDYYEFIDQGVRGIGAAPRDTEGLRKNTGKFAYKTPFVSRGMVQSIREWGASRGRKDVTVKNMNTVAYLTAKKVKRLGIEQTLFFTEATDNMFIEELANRLNEALGQRFDIELTIE